MTDANASPASIAPPALGVGALVGDSFRVYGQCFVPATLATLVPQLFLTLVSVALLGASVTADPSTMNPDTVLASSGLLSILTVVIGGISTAVVTRIVFDTKTGRTADLGAAVQSALPRLLPIIVLSFAVGVLVVLGFALFIVPGLWLFGVYAVYAQAIVVEKADWKAMGRSSALTLGYRWPIVGLLLVMLLILVAAAVLLGVISLAFYALNDLLGVLAETVLGSVPMALFSVAPVLLYARLCEIKEGRGNVDLAKVFE
ncbi:MAG: hypothetical protein AAF677_15435 [Pseudomonadota bacterium]